MRVDLVNALKALGPSQQSTFSQAEGDRISEMARLPERDKFSGLWKTTSSQTGNKEAAWELKVTRTGRLTNTTSFKEHPLAAALSRHVVQFTTTTSLRGVPSQAIACNSANTEDETPPHCIGCRR